MQSVLAVAPVVFWYVLTGHSAQSSTPRPSSSTRYVPFGHCSEIRKAKYRRTSLFAWRRMTHET